VRFHKIRFYAQGLLIISNRLVKLALSLKRDAEIIAGFGKIRLNLKGPAVTIYRFIKPAPFLKQCAQILVCLDEGRFKLYG
jgi:hypothetical protein